MSPNPQRLLYRPYQPPDLDQAVGVWLESWRSIGAPAPKNVAQKELQARFEREVDEGWRVTIAQAGAVIVGFLALKPALGVLDQLFILPSFQSMGIGSHLLGVAMTEMPRGFSLRTAADNTQARRFYEKHGMAQVRLEPHPVHGHLTAIYSWRA